MGVGKSKNVIKDACPIGHAKPTTLEELKELYTNESSMCKIIYETIEEGKIEKVRYWIFL